MLRRNRMMAVVSCLYCVGAVIGCGSSEDAIVAFSYVVQPDKGLPPGMNTIYVRPAKCGPGTDEKWADMCATAVRSLIFESKDRYGTDVRLIDREDTDVTFDEADLAAAGMSNKQGGGGGQLSAAQGAVLIDITVKKQLHKGKKRTLTDLSVWGGGGRHWGHGGGSAHTEEVDTATRNLTVQMEFKLLDTANNDIWSHLKPRDYNATDRTKASPIFGSSKTEADMTPTDNIIGGLVEEAAREFVSKLMPCRISVDVSLESSHNEFCAQGVKMLRGEMFDEALSHFKQAIAEDSTDHEAAFGAGVACEASGRYDQAEKYYRMACVEDDNPEYAIARDRMKTYGGRIRKEQ